MNILAEIKEENCEAADWLLYYSYRRRQFYKNKQDETYASSLPEVVIRTGPGNPTAFHAMRLCSLDACEQWLEAVETVEDNLEEKKLVFLKYRREAAYITKKVRGKSAWVLYVQRHYAEEMAKLQNKQPEDCWLSETTMKEWWTEIIELTARVLLKIKTKHLKKI
ncbi:hypothetical protein [Sporomusa ovata]|nr:hypothetical protein [Sporomusa ovata]